MKLVEHYIMRGTRRLVLIIVGFLIFIFASYSAQRYLTEAANGTLALDVVLDIVFYKVLIALEMLLPVGLYASVGVTLGQMYTDSEITAISAAGGSPGRLYKAVLYLAIPLSIFVTLLSMYGRPWAYAQIYQLEQQSQSELDVRQLRAKKFNTNDNGRMILSQTVDQDNNRLTDALIYTSTANRTRIFRARSVDVVDPSPEKPTVMLHNGTAYLLDHQGRDDNEQIYRNLQLHLNPLDQSPNVKRKAKSVTELARSTFPADHAELQWRQSRGLTALLMALLAISLCRVKPRQGRFSTFFRFRTGRLAGGRSGNTVGRQQIDSRGHAKFALDPCCQRVDKLPATFFIADPTLDLQNDFFLGGNKSNRIARMNFRFLFRNIFNILRPDITATNNNQIFNASGDIQITVQQITEVAGV